ncbi:MAG: hypothetical protein ACYC27_11395 [Armatimonadota bacterium]
MVTNRKSFMLNMALVILLLSAVVLPSAAAVPTAVLGIPSGYYASMALAINTSGQITGMYSDVSGGHSIASLWLANGTPIVLGTLDDVPGENLDYVDSKPNAINTSGQVVGISTATKPLGGGGYEYLNRATFWSYDADTGKVVAKDLGTYGVLTQSEALDINDEGLILCKSWTTDVEDDKDDVWYLQDKEGTQTPITMSDGTPINADGWGFLANSGMLNSEGKVAGIADIGYWDINTPSVWHHQYDQAVIWGKTATGGEAIAITPSGHDAMVTGISDNGVVVGSTDTVMGTLPFVYDSINGYQSLSISSDDPLISVAFGLATSVNNAGQVSVSFVFYDGVSTYGQLWIWDNAAGEWTHQLPFESILPIGTTASQAIGFINNTGQVTGIVMSNPNNDYFSFLWSAGIGMQSLSGLGDSETIALAINDSGVSIGMAGLSSGSNMIATAWGLPMTLTNVTASRGKRTVTVKLEISNPTSTALTDVIVQASSLMDLYNTDQTVYDALLTKPISVGSIKAGSSKKITLQFSANIPTQTTGQLKLNITSSQGTYNRYAIVNVP